MQPVRSLALALGLCTLVGCGGSPSGDGTIAALPAETAVRLDVPTFYTRTTPGLGTSLPWLAEQVARTTGGSVTMNVSEPGKLLAPGEILDAVSSGEVAAGWASAGFWSGKMPAAPLFSAIPFGPEAPEYLAWFYQGNGLRLYQEMYDSNGYQVKVLLAGMSAPETSGWFAKEITGPADLQGLKMRIFGLGGTVMAKLGVATSQLPGAEIYDSLDKGVIDCAEYATPAADATKGFYKVAKYNYFPGWHQQATAFELLINQRVWNSLSEQQRAAIEVACQASVLHSLAESEALQAPAMQANIDQHGVEVRYWSDEMLGLFHDTWQQVATEQAAADPFFARVWQDLQEFRASYAVWQAKGFLPRRP